MKMSRCRSKVAPAMMSMAESRHARGGFPYLMGAQRSSVPSGMKFWNNLVWSKIRSWSREVWIHIYIDLTDWWDVERATDDWFCFCSNQSSDVIPWNRIWYTMWHDTPNDSCFGNSFWSLFAILKVFHEVICFIRSKEQLSWLTERISDRGLRSISSLLQCLHLL